MSVSAVRVLIEGQVQGVWFRAWTIQQASARGLDGWVRNRDDGTVEALFSGAADAVEAMVKACWEGPPGGRVRATFCPPRRGRAAFLAVKMPQKCGT